MGQSIADASSQAAMHNKSQLNSHLLAGIGPRKRGRILNWNLT
jgi:hypothetical protein